MKNDQIKLTTNRPSRNRKQRRMEASLLRRHHVRKDPNQTIKGIIRTMKQSKITQEKILNGELDAYLGNPDQHLKGEKVE